MQSFGFRTCELKVDRSGINPFKELLLIVKLARILRKIKPAVIHNVTLKMSIYSSIASRFSPKAKVINAISGLGYNFTADRKTDSQNIISILMKFAFSNRGYSFIFQNPDDQRLFQRLNFERGNRFYVIKGSGIDLSEFSFTERKEK